jgi:alpha-beta hydrolase superfamily lysophospholipase
MSHHTETTLTSSTGEKMFVRRWQPEVTPTGAAVLSHGVFEHSGRYHHVAERFLKHGYAVWALDHYGHGQSDGRRGDIRHANHFIDDLKLLISNVTSKSGRKPVLLGHSMGGAIAALYAVRFQDTLRALALSSPALKAHASPALIAFGKIAGALLPTAQAPAGLSQPATRNPDWEKWKEGDALKHGSMSLRLAKFIVEAGEEAIERAQQLNLPVAMFVSGEDTYVDKQGSQLFFSRLKPGIGEYHEYPGFLHEVFNELDQERPLSDLEAWIGKVDNEKAL